MSTLLTTSKNATGTIGPPPGTFFFPPGGDKASLFGPDGRKLTPPVPADEEAIMYAVIDLAMCSQARLRADLVGHFARAGLRRHAATPL
jgi:hypothetical protein